MNPCFYFCLFIFLVHSIYLLAYALEVRPKYHIDSCKIINIGFDSKKRRFVNTETPRGSGTVGWAHTRARTHIHPHTHTGSAVSPLVLFYWCGAHRVPTQPSVLGSPSLWPFCLMPTIFWRTGISTVMVSYQSVNTSLISPTFRELAAEGRSLRVKWWKSMKKW